MTPVREIVERGIATWGAIDQLMLVQEACAGAVSDIAWARRSHADTDQLADAAAGLRLAAEALEQIVGTYEVHRKLNEKIAALDVDIAMHKASHSTIGGMA